MSFDLKTALVSFAPTLAGMLGGPLAGGAVATLEQVLGLTPGAGTDAVSQVLQSGAMTPDQMGAVRKADQEHEERLKAMGIDLVKVNNAHEEALALAVIDDRKDARKLNTGNLGTWRIAYVVLATFAVIMGATLWGCWTLLSGGITTKDVAVVAAVAGLVGSIVGYVAANAQTVINFIFGGSLGSEKKTDAMAASVQQAIAGVAK
jgi:hypothetical protein